MADPFEASNAFVANVLEDNQRLREENADLRKLLTEARMQASEAGRRHAHELYRMVRAAGGALKVPPHDGGQWEQQRLLVDRTYGPYGDGANYRLVPENEIAGGEILEVAA